MAAENPEDLLRRRVQHKIAEQFLMSNQPESTVKLSDEMDADLQKKFERKFAKYRSSTSPYTAQNFTWLLAAMSVLYYTDTINVIRYDEHINRLWFNIGAILILVNASIAIFLIGWLCYIKKVPHTEWEKHYPAAIPVATASFLIGSLCVTVGLWPVWTYLTPLILFTIFMGVVVVIVMIPNF